MRNMLFAAGLLAASLALPAGAFAADEPAVPDLLKILPCPPQSDVKPGAGIACAQNPALQKRDYKAVLDAQKNASEEEKKLAIADAARPSLAQFGRPIWQEIAAPACAVAPEIATAPDDQALAATLPATVDLIHAMTKDSIMAVDGAKQAFGRLRPYQAEVEGLPRISALLPTDNLKKSPSYPSGHTAFAYETALVLASLLPEEQDRIYARAAQYSHNRLVAGVHFQSDVEQGRLSGELVAAAFMQREDFRAKLEKARPELRKALCQ